METIVAKKTTGKKNKKNVNSKEKQKLVRVISVLLIFCVSLVAIAFICITATQALFTQNERLTLRRMELHGMSDKRTKAMIKYLKLNFKQDNLFNLDIAQIRKKIEKISYIKSASVYRILPDTLKINVIQRIPLAYLFKYNSKWLIDEDAVVLNRKSCMKLKYSLAVIKNFECQTIKSGETLANLAAAIKLIKLTRYEFQKFKISSISLQDPNKIVFIMIKKPYAYKILIPPNNIKKSLQVLRFALNKRKGRYKATIDLTYNNQAIFK